MSELVREITDEEFASVTGNGVALVDFWAPWCGPCQMQGPILEEVARETGESATIAKINIDKNQQVAGQLGIQSIPTLLLIRDGEIVDRFTGVQTKETLLAAITGVNAAQR